MVFLIYKFNRKRHFFIINKRFLKKYLSVGKGVTMQENSIYNVFGEPMILEKGKLYSCYVGKKGIVCREEKRTQSKKADKL